MLSNIIFLINLNILNLIFQNAFMMELLKIKIIRDFCIEIFQSLHTFNQVIKIIDEFRLESKVYFIKIF